MKTELTATQSKKLIKLGVDKSKGLCKAGVTFFTLDQCLELVPSFKLGLLMIVHEKDLWYVGSTATYFYRDAYHARELIDAVYKLLVVCYSNNKD